MGVDRGYARFRGEQILGRPLRIGPRDGIEARCFSSPSELFVPARSSLYPDKFWYNREIIEDSPLRLA